MGGNIEITAEEIRMTFKNCFYVTKEMDREYVNKILCGSRWREDRHEYF